MRRRPDPRRSVTVCAGVCPDECYEFFDRLRRQRRVDRKHLGRGDRERDRVEVPLRIIGDFVVQAGIDDVGGSVGDQRGVTVRRRLRRPAHADIAAGARYVLDVVLFAKMLGQLLRDQPGDHVGLAAGRIGHDQTHRPGRIGLRRRRSRIPPEGRQRPLRDEETDGVEASWRPPFERCCHGAARTCET